MASIIKPGQAGKGYTDTGTSQSGTGQAGSVAPATAILPKAPVTTAPATSQAATSGITAATVLKKGTKSNEVTLLQQALNAKGYNLAVDGSYGGATQAAVIAYQKSMGLSADGVAGVNTLTSLGLLGQPAATGQNAGLPYHPIDQYTDTGTSKSGTGQAAHVRPVDTIQPAITGAAPKPAGASSAASQPAQGQTIPQTQQKASTVATGGSAGIGGAGAGSVPASTGAGSTQAVVPPTTGYTPSVEVPRAEQVAQQAPNMADYLLPEYQPRDNPYLLQLETMEFDYNPFEDEDYLRQAAEYEQQVVDMMVGRGGLWSSVTTNALQASLLYLQQNMTKQKFEEFKAERDFVFQLAQFTADENQRDFQNYMTQQEFRFAQYQDEWKRYTWQVEFAFEQEKEAWKRYAWEEEFAFQKDQETWKRYAWEQEFNFQRNQAAISNALAQAKFKADQANAAAQLKLQQQKMQQDAANARYNLFSDKVSNNIVEAYDVMQSAGKNLVVDERKMLEFVEAWAGSDLGKASPNVAEYFGVTKGTNFSSSTAQSAITRKATELKVNAQEILDYATVFGREKDLFDDLNSWYERNANYQTFTHPEQLLPYKK